MGTYVIGSGGDYVSFAAAESALTLPEAGGTTYIVTGSVVGNIGFSAADYANGLTLQAQSGEEADGLLTGAFIDGIVTFGDINATANNLRIEKIDVTQLSANQANFNDCVIGQTSTSDAITFDDSSRAIYTNCIIIDGADDGMYSAGSAITTVQLIKCTIVDAARYGAMRCLMTDVLSIGSGTADFLTPATGSDYLASGDSSAATTNSFTGRTTADFVDYAGGNYNVTGFLLTAGSDGGPIGAVLTGFVNSDPSLDDPEPDFSQPFGWTGDIDVGENFSDANTGDTLTFSDDNNFAANDGVTFNAATGVFTLDGTLAQGVYNVAVTASDGNGGTYPVDEFTVTITAPVLVITDVSDTTPEAGTNITIEHSNADVSPVTAGDFDVVSDVDGVATIFVFNPITKVLAGQTYPTVNFLTNINIPLADNTTTVNQAIQIQPPAGTYFAEISSIPANSTYAATPAIEVGHFSHVFNVSGNWVIDAATGVFLVDGAGGSLDYTIYNGEWATPITHTVAARPSGTVSIDSLVPGRNGAVVNFSYPGSDLTGFQYRIDGGSWINAASPLNITGQVSETQYTLDLVAVNDGRQGDVTTVVYSTTDAVDTTPNAFSITPLTGQALSSPAVFAAVTVQGVDAGVDVPVSIEDLTSVGATYAVSTNGGTTWGAETSSPGNVRLNHLVRVTFANAGTHLTQRQARLSIGGVQATATSTTLADTVNPVITLIGGNQTLTEGDAWADPGFTATDNADGDITNNVQVTGSVNPAVPGTYILSYYVADAVGNETTVTRTVTVNAQVVITPMTQILTPENLSLDIIGEPGTTIKMFAQSNNRFSVLLKVDGVALDLSVFSRLVLKLDAVTTVDSDEDEGIDWSNGNGEILLDIGSYLTGKGSVETTMLAYRSGITRPYVLWHPSLASKLRIEKIEL